MTFWTAFVIVVGGMVAVWVAWFLLQWLLEKLTWWDDPPSAAALIILLVLVAAFLAFAISHPEGPQ